jgi:exopolysaccharide production protein ExoZ
MLQWLRRTLELTDPKHARLLPMEGLRGLAVTLVFLQHYSYQGLTNLALDPITAGFATALRHYGNLGVELFYILSGYLIYGNLVSKRPTFLRFMARRIERLYPTFLCVFSLAVALHLSRHTGKIPADPVDATLYLLANMLYLPGLFPIRPLTAVNWSLSYEMFFYLFLSLTVAGLGLDRRSRAFRIGMILGCSVLLSLVALIVGVSGEHGGVPIRALPFFAGMLLFEAETAGWMAASGPVGLIAPVVSFVLSIFLPLPPVPYEWLHTICLALLCSACFHGGNIAARAFTWTPLRWLGNMSYSYYLLHGFPILFLLEHLYRLPIASMPSLMFWSMLPVLYAASIAASFVLFAVIERPISLRPQHVVRAQVRV